MSGSNKRPTIPALVLLTLLLAFPPAAAIGSEAAAARAPNAESAVEARAADYEQLGQWAFSAEAVALPADGVRLTRDTAEWFFEGGTVRPMRPTADGTVTGLVFEGTGRFRMGIPDPVEANQLQRFTLKTGEPIEPPGTPATRTIEHTFHRLVLRTTDQRVIGLFPAADNSIFLVNPLAEACHLRWLGHGRFDAEARIVAGLLNQDGEYLAVDVETDGLGWMFYEFDPWRMEEIRLCRMPEEYDHVEVWVSLDRAEHRLPDGRPGSTRTPLLDLVHADLEVDLMDHEGRVGEVISRGGKLRGSNMSLQAEGSEAGVSAAAHPPHGKGRPFPLTRFRARMTFTSAVDGLQALPLRLNPWAGLVTARDTEGRPLPVLRAGISERFPRIPIHEEDTSTVVLLRQPLAKGETVTVDLAWERRTTNYPGKDDPEPAYIEPDCPYHRGGGQDWHPPLRHAGGRYWYPEPLEGWNDRHTARVTVIHPRNLQVRATGTPAGSSEDGPSLSSTWVSETPIKSAAFAYGHRYTERRILGEGLPEVVAFGPNIFLQLGDEAEVVAAHVADSIRFYQETFGLRLPSGPVACAGVYGGSQSYSGFIALSSRYFTGSAPKGGELTLALKTAELFWGDMIDWQSYRDAWLARALTEISVALYRESVIASGSKRLTSFTNYEDRSAERRFLRHGGMPNDRYRRNHWLGPLDVGFRDRLPEMIMRRSYHFAATFSSAGFDSHLPLETTGIGPGSTAARGSQASLTTVRTNLGDCRFKPTPAWQRHLLQNRTRRQEVLYMLRDILRTRYDDGDERFAAILADFLKTCAGRPASTRLFIAAVEHNTGEDWDWYFDQWVYGTAVPTYNWGYGVFAEPDDDGRYRLDITMTQSAVPDDFRMPVTFGLEYEDADPEVLHIFMDQPSKTFSVELERKPTSVTFDPYQQLLYVKE